MFLTAISIWLCLLRRRVYYAQFMAGGDNLEMVSSQPSITNVSVFSNHNRFSRVHNMYEKIFQWLKYLDWSKTGDRLPHKLSVFRCLRKYAKATVSFAMSLCPSVRMEQFCSQLKDFHKFFILQYFSKLSRKFNLNSYLTRTTGTLHEDRYKLYNISCSVLFSTRNFSQF